MARKHRECACGQYKANAADSPHDDDLDSLQKLLVESGAGDSHAIASAVEESHGLGLFIRSLVGLDRQAALEAFGHFLDGSRFDTNQINFINLIIDELAHNGIVEPARLYEPPYTDLTAKGPEEMFDESDVVNIVDILNRMRDNASPSEGVA